MTATLAGHARERPEAVALRIDRHSITYRMLDQIVGCLAAYLRTRCGTARSIALHLPNSPAMALFILASIRAGHEAMVFDPHWPAAWTAALHARLMPALLVTTASDIVAPEVLLIEDPYLGFDAVLAAFGDPSSGTNHAEPHPEAPFSVGFTSGSTGLPKGYRRDQRSWLESFRSDAAEFPMFPEDCLLAPGSLTHSLFLYAFMRGLHAGATTILCRRFNPRDTIGLMDSNRVSLVYGVPTQYSLILDAADGRTLPTPRRLFSSGAKFPSRERPRLGRVFPNAEFCEFYGSSELSYVTLARQSEQVPPGSVGRAFTGVTLTIRDRAGRRLPQGRRGIVYVESAMQFTRYLGGSEDDVLRHRASASVGDVGWLDENGFLTLVGRANRMILSSGRNIHPEEIERLLTESGYCRQAAVIPIEDNRRGEALFALLHVGEGAMPLRSELIGYLRQRLPLYKVPRHYAELQEWPLTASGKSDFPALQRLSRSGRLRRLT